MQTKSQTRIEQTVSPDADRETKIAHMQALVDEALASGISSKTMEDIRREARAKLGYGVSS